MSVPLTFYETAAQVIPVFLLLEGVRAGLLLRDTDVRDIELENDASNKEMSDLEADVAQLKQKQESLVMEAATIATTEEVQDRIKKLETQIKDVQENRNALRVTRTDLDKRANSISRRARKLETRTVAFIVLTVVIEAAGVLAALLIIANPGLHSGTTFTLVYGSLCIGVAGVMQQLFIPLTIEKPQGRGPRVVNRMLNLSVLVPIVAFLAGVTCVLF